MKLSAISVVFIIIFNSEKGWKDTKSYRKIKLADVWTELNTKFCFLGQYI